MVALGIVLWIAMIILIIIAFVSILAFRGSEAHPIADIVLDFFAMIILLFVGAVFASAFVPDGWAGPIHDAITFGWGYNDAPPQPTYTPNADKPSTADLSAMRPTESWNILIGFKDGADGVVSLPEDNRVESIEAWTVDARGIKSLSVHVK